MPGPDKAVTYSRVSSLKQCREGHGLDSQTTKCREYAKMKGYEIIKTFQDEGVSGGEIERPAMQEMLQFLKERKRKNEQTVVIIDEISRLARGLLAHITLRISIRESGGVLESPTHEFGESSNEQLVENLLASVSQHFRQKNAETVKNRMRSRLLNGYWVFSASHGYRYEEIEGHGKLLIRDEPAASVIEEGLLGYASGRFQTQSEVQRFFQSRPAFPKGKSGIVSPQVVQDILKKTNLCGLPAQTQLGYSPPKRKTRTTHQLRDLEINPGPIKRTSQSPGPERPARGFSAERFCHLRLVWPSGNCGVVQGKKGALSLLSLFYQGLLRLPEIGPKGKVGG